MDLRYITRAASRAQSLAETNRRRGAYGRHSAWSADEIATIRALLPDYQAILRALPSRSYDAIRYRANLLGLTPTRRMWTANEVSKLRKLYPTASWTRLFSELPGASKWRIKDKAKYLGLHRPKIKFKLTPWPALNSLRERASYLGYTMVDVDAMAGTGRYFQKGGWTWRRPNPAYLAKAIAALAGGMSIWWHDSEGAVDDFAPIPKQRHRRPSEIAKSPQRP